jgi:hypothetical protein
MPNDCNNPNCGWKLYEVKINTKQIEIERGKTTKDTDALDKDKPSGAEAIAALEKIRDKYNDSKNLTIPFKKDQCVPCECVKVGDPIWEDKVDKDYKVVYRVEGWIVSCDAEVKQGKQLGICKPKPGKDGKKTLTPLE